MLGLSGFKEVLLELLEALEGVLHDKDIASIFRGEQGAAAATHAVT